VGAAAGLRRWLLRGAAVALPVVGALLWAERWAGRRLDATLHTRLPVPLQQGVPCFEPDRELTLARVPGACGADAEGYLSTAGGSEPSSVQGRVVLLGDSIAESYGQGGALRTWVRGAGWPEAEVWNLAVPGFDTCGEAGMLGARGWALDPELVVLMVCVNDFAPSGLLTTEPDGLVVRTPAGEQRLPPWAAYGDLALWFALTRASPPQPSAVDNEGVAFARCLGEMTGAAREREVPFLAALVPYLDDGAEAGGVHRRNEDRMRQLLAASGAAWVDLRPALVQVGSLESMRVEPSDRIHPGGAGRLAIGRAIVEAAVAQGLLPGATPPPATPGPPPAGEPG